MFEEKGIFSVKSCYRKLTGECDTQYAAFWKKVWAAKLPGKIANFVWRTCSDCLPTNTKLAAKKVRIEPQCPWCNMYDENEVHALFECEFARLVWVAVGLSNLINIMPGNNVFTVLMRVFGGCTGKQIVLIMLFCWSIWNRRNKWVWDRVNMSVVGVKLHVMNLLREWRQAQQDVHKYKSVVSSSNRRWSVPPPGYVKVNIDATLFNAENCVGIGGVIRDSDSRFLHARCSKVEVSMAPREAEAFGLKEALSWVKLLGFKSCIFETDSKLLADACKGSQGRSFFHTIVDDCIEYFKHFDHVLVDYVHMSANGAAHLLARATRSLSDSQEWFQNAPDFMYDALQFDNI